MFRRGRIVQAASIATTLALVLAWLISYAIAFDLAFRPLPTRWCQLGLNCGTLSLATQPWPATQWMQTGLLGYNARHEDARLSGFGGYASLSGRSLGGHNGVAVVALPLWPLIVLTIWLAFRSLRAPRRDDAGRCRTCGYDLRATPDRCPECGRIA